VAKRRGRETISKTPAVDGTARGGKITALDPKSINRQISRQVRSQTKAIIEETVRTTISTVRNTDWLGPQQPVPPQAPPDSSSDLRLWDYQPGYNLNWQPRKYTPFSHAQLRWLADNLDLLREVIERRKDEINGDDWDIVGRDEDIDVDNDPDVKKIKEFFHYPDGQHPFPVWQRMILEEMYVTDAATVYPWLKANGEPYRFELLDGATITPLIDEAGRLPEPPDPAYMQVIQGMPYRFKVRPGMDSAIDPLSGATAPQFNRDEIVYFPRNPRVHNPVYGYPQVEQLVMTISIAIKAELRDYYYFTEGTLPDAMVGVPEEWTPKQIAQFQSWFDSLMRGNLQRRSGGVVFIPGGAKTTATKDYGFKKEQWEWYARVVCAAFHVSPQPYVSEVNRATAQTAQVMQISEGTEPDKEWFAALMNLLIANYFHRPDLRFQWQEDELDVLEQANADGVLVDKGIQTRDEIRVRRGQDPKGGNADKLTVTGASVTLVEDIGKQSEPVAAPANGNGRQPGANGNGKQPDESQPAQKADRVYRMGKYVVPKDIL
jgi:hypothetical protein